jgi:hypothetical protein
MKVYFLFFATFLFVFCACETERSRLAKVPVTVEVQRFEQDLFSINDENFNEKILFLQAKYDEFFTLFCNNIIEVGTPDSLNFKPKLLEFLSDTSVRQGYEKSQIVFADTKKLDATFTLAFKRFRLHFPHDSIPQVYTFVAGFNQSVILADGVVAVGLDKYLGADFAPYAQMGFYRYLLRNMYPEKMPNDAIRFFAGALFPSPTGTVLQRIVWEGKLLYFAKQMLPNEPDSSLFGFSHRQIKNCLDNEAYMWDVLVRNQLLFSQNYRDIREMSEEAPFTLRFSQEAPGRAGNWIGYRIVSEYMRHNRDVTLPQLMTNYNAQEILDKSRYNPR